MKNLIQSGMGTLTVMPRRTFFLRHAFVLLLLTLGLAACRQSTEQATKPAGTPVSIAGYNYTIEGIQEFYVNGAWGGGVSIGGGNGRVCCVQLPDKWTPGLSATVKWERSDCGGNGPGNARCPFGTGGHGWYAKSIEATVPIEPYDQPDTFQVMFLPKDEIKLYVFAAGPGHPSHPSQLGDPHPIGHPEWKR